MSQSYVWDSFDYDESYRSPYGLYQQITTNSKPKNTVTTNNDGSVTVTISNGDVTTTEVVSNPVDEIELKNEEDMAINESIHQKIKRMAMEEAAAKFEAVSKGKRRSASMSSQGISHGTPPPSNMGGGKVSHVFEDPEVKREKERINMEKRNQASEKNFKNVDPCNHVGSDDSDFLQMIKNMDKENNRSQPRIVKNPW